MFETILHWFRDDNKNQDNQSGDFLGLKAFVENVKSFFRGAYQELRERLGIEGQTQRELATFREAIQTDSRIKPPEYGVSIAERMKIFGDNDAEVRRQLVPIKMWGHLINVHRKVAPILTRIEKQVREYENSNGIQERWRPRQIQCQNWRNIVGMNTLSNHAFGATLDINHSTNGLTYDPIEDGKNTDIPPYVRTIFKQNGYDWGGDWSKRKDPMHFEPSVQLLTSLA